MSESALDGPRVLVVEDEYLIRMLLEDMLADLGYGVAAAVGSIAEASQFAADGQFHCAILDVNVDGQEIFPVADILAKRALPFVFVTGYGEQSLPEPYRGRPDFAEAVPGRAAQGRARRAAGAGVRQLRMPTPRSGAPKCEAVLEADYSFRVQRATLALRK